MRISIAAAVLFMTSIASHASERTPELVGEAPLSRAEARELVHHILNSIPEALRNPEPRVIIGDPRTTEGDKHVRVIFQPHTVDGGAELAVVVDCSNLSNEEPWSCVYDRERRDVLLADQQETLALLGDLELETAMLLLTHSRRLIDETPALAELKRRYPTFPVFVAAARSAFGLYTVWTGNRSGDVILTMSLQEVSADSGNFDVSLESFDFIKGAPK